MARFKINTSDIDKLMRQFENMSTHSWFKENCLDYNNKLFFDSKAPEFAFNKPTICLVDFKKTRNGLVGLTDTGEELDNLEYYDLTFASEEVKSLWENLS